MALIRIDRNPSRGQLLTFGGIWLVFFGAIGAWLAYKGVSRELVGGLWGLAALVPAVGLVFRPFLRWVYLGASYAAWPIGWVVSHLLLGIVYYLILTPIGWALRLSGRDPLQRRTDPETGSYWQPRGPAADPQRYFRQF